MWSLGVKARRALGVRLRNSGFVPEARKNRGKGWIRAGDDEAPGKWQVDSCTGVSGAGGGEELGTFAQDQERGSCREDGPERQRRAWR